MKENILKIQELNKSYSDVKVLKNISFQLEEGEVHAIVGENGAGKSTLIKIIAGAEKPDKGSRIWLYGRNIVDLTTRESIKMGISVIYQDVNLFPNLTVAENICIGLFKGFIVDWKKIKLTAKNSLEKIQCLDIDINVKLKDLSVGKQQLVALAKAITLNSKIIIMDEPTASLSVNEVKKLYHTVKMLKENNISIIYISHKIEEIFKVANRISVLRDGEMVATKNVSDTNAKDVISMMIGHKLDFESMKNKGQVGKEIFQVKNLTKNNVFKDISFSLYENEILGITGLVGSRRSEVAQAIFGLMKLDKGEVFLNNIKLNIKNTSQAIEKGIVYLPEDRREQGIFSNQNIYINITITNLNKVLNKFRLIDKQGEVKVALEYIEKLNIKPNNPKCKLENLSGGNQQKVLFSRWINSNPSILIVDEPTSGVDIKVKAEIHRLLRKIASSGVGVILISSDISEVLAISDRIIVMKEGEIVEEINPDNINQEYILMKGLIGNESKTSR